MAKKKKKRKRPTVIAAKRPIADLAKTDGQEYATVLKVLGDRRVELKCMDGKKRIGRIRPTLRRQRKFIMLGDYVLIGLRDFQDEKADVLDKYTKDEIARLENVGELPKLEEVDFDKEVIKFDEI